MGNETADDKYGKKEKRESLFHINRAPLTACPVHLSIE